MRPNKHLWNLWHLWIVVIAGLAVTTSVMAKSRRTERHPLKTFHACPRGVCAETEAGKFVDTDDSTFLLDPAGESRLTNLEIDTTQTRSGRLLIRAPEDATQLMDPRFTCTQCVHKADVDRNIVQLRDETMRTACLQPRRALQGIEYGPQGNVLVTCVEITEQVLTPQR